MSGPQVTERTLDILEALAALGTASLPQIRQRSGVPTTTTHRILQSLVDRRFVMRTARGSYRLGSAVIAIADGLTFRTLLPPAARLPLQHLARQTRGHTHLGVWEAGMVTYLVKQPYGKTRLHSAEGMQLEAYCSAIGKVLLAGLPDAELAQYLEEGDFVPLTPRTITDPGRLRDEIGRVRQRGWATDGEEISLGLHCTAMPIRDRAGATLAAVSVSTPSADAPDPAAMLPMLRQAADAIEQELFPAMIGQPK